MNTTNDGLAEGIRRKETGIAQVSMHDPGFAEHVRGIIEELAASGAIFTSDDVQNRLRIAPFHVNSVGAAMSGAAKRKVITRISYAKSGRACAHARVVGVYVGTQYLEGASR